MALCLFWRRCEAMGEQLERWLRQTAEMEGLHGLSQASAHMKASGVAAREFTRSPCGKTPAQMSGGDIKLRIAFVWTLFLCAVSLANGSGQPDVPSTAGGKHFFGRALVKVPEDLSLEKLTLTSQQTSSSYENTKCSEGTSQAELKLLTPKTDPGASQASYATSSYSLASTHGRGDSVPVSRDVTGTHILRISQSHAENASTLVQPQPEVSDGVLLTPLYAPMPSVSEGAISDAAPDTRVKGLPAASPTYDEVVRELRLEGRFPPHTAQRHLTDEVSAPVGRDGFDLMLEDALPPQTHERDSSDQVSVPVGGDEFSMLIEDNLPSYTFQSDLFHDISLSDDTLPELAFSELPTARERHLSRSVDKAMLMCMGIIILIFLLSVGLSALGL